MSNFAQRARTSVQSFKVPLIIVGLVAVAVVGYSLSSSPKTPVPTSEVPTGNLKGTNPIQGSAPIDQNYSNQLDKADKDRLDTAKQNGQTAFPTLRPSQSQTIPQISVIDPPKQDAPKVSNDPPKITQQPILVQAPVTQNVPIVAPPSAINTADQKARTDELAKYMASAQKKIPVADVITFGDSKDFEKKAEQSSPSIDQASTTAANKSKIKIPLAGNILYAVLVGRADSDVPGPVIAKILQGEYKGATLVGTFKKANENLIISFNKLTVEKTADGEEINETVAINAVAVDTANIGTGLSTSVDRHLFEKLAIGFTSAFAQGFGQAVSNKGSTTYSSPTGTVTTSNGNLDTREQLLSAGGSAIAKSGQILDSEFGNRPTTVVVDGGTAIGVLFL